MENPDKQSIVILSKTKLFKGLEHKALLDLSQAFRQRTFKADEIVFREEDQGQSMMVVLEGELRVSFLAGRDEETLMVLRSGDFFGEMALLDDLPRSASVMAITAVRLLEIERRDFLAFLKKDAASGVLILFRICKALSARLRETDQRVRTFVHLAQWL